MSRQVVNLLLEYEETLAALYADCARLFPEIQAFFDLLSAEEMNHAAAIRELLAQVNGMTVYLDENRYKVRPLTISLEYVQDVHRRLTAGNLTLMSTLSLVHDIEVSVIESDYFNIFSGDSAHLNHNLNRLREESKHHRDKIQAMLEELKKM